jgi:hypothetical protein
MSDSAPGDSGEFALSLKQFVQKSDLGQVQKIFKKTSEIPKDSVPAFNRK